MDKEDFKRVRGALGLSRQELADRIGYSAAYVGSVERGKTPITVEYCKSIIEVVNSKDYQESINLLIEFPKRLHHLTSE